MSSPRTISSVQRTRSRTRSASSPQGGSLACLRDGWGQGAPGGREVDATFDDFAKDRFLIGDAEQVKDGILRCADLAKTDHIQLRVQCPGLAHHEALSSIERVGSIMAALR